MPLAPEQANGRAAFGQQRMVLYQARRTTARESSRVVFY